MKFEHLIIGAGFGGLNLARALCESGADPKGIALVDDYADHRGSNLPLALVHPFVGRSLKTSASLVSAWQAAKALIESVAMPSQIASPIELIRPFDKTKGARLATSYEKYAPILRDEFELSLLSQKETRNLYPFLNQVEGAISIRSAYKVDLRVLCEILKKTLLDRGVVFLHEKVIGVNLGGDTSRIKTPYTSLEATKIIFAPGSQLSAFFPQLPLAPTRGHLAQIRWSKAIPQNLGLSMGGHLIHQNDNQWLLGTTYFSPDESPSDETEIFQLMRDSLVRWLPALAEAQLVSLWSGVRCVLPPNRQPVAGALPGPKNAFVLSGFGSKGGLWAPYTAKKLAQLIFSKHSESVDEDILNPSSYAVPWKLRSDLET